MDYTLLKLFTKYSNLDNTGISFKSIVQLLEDFGTLKDRKGIERKLVRIFSDFSTKKNENLLIPFDNFKGALNAYSTLLTNGKECQFPYMLQKLDSSEMDDFDFSQKKDFFKQYENKLFPVFSYFFQCENFKCIHLTDLKTFWKALKIWERFLNFSEFFPIFLTKKDALKTLIECIEECEKQPKWSNPLLVKDNLHQSINLPKNSANLKVDGFHFFQFCLGVFFEKIVLVTQKSKNSLKSLKFDKQSSRVFFVQFVLENFKKKFEKNSKNLTDYVQPWMIEALYNDASQKVSGPFQKFKKEKIDSKVTEEKKRILKFEKFCNEFEYKELIKSVFGANTNQSIDLALHEISQYFIQNAQNSYKNNFFLTKIQVETMIDEILLLAPKKIAIRFSGKKLIQLAKYTLKDALTQQKINFEIPKHKIFFLEFIFILNEAIMVLLNLDRDSTKNTNRNNNGGGGTNFGRLLKFGYENIKELLNEAFLKEEKTEQNQIIVAIMDLCKTEEGVKK